MAFHFWHGLPLVMRSVNTNYYETEWDIEAVADSPLKFTCLNDENRAKKKFETKVNQSHTFARFIASVCSASFQEYKCCSLSHRSMPGRIVFGRSRANCIGINTGLFYLRLCFWKEAWHTYPLLDFLAETFIESGHLACKSVIFDIFLT